MLLGLLPAPSSCQKLRMNGLLFGLTHQKKSQKAKQGDDLSVTV